jgi:glutamate-ammonia-ligase adenylyltransferase
MTDFDAQIEFLKQHSSYAQRWLNSRPEWADWLRSQGAQKVEVIGIGNLLRPCRDALAAPEQD